MDNLPALRIQVRQILAEAESDNKKSRRKAGLSIGFAALLATMAVVYLMA